MEDFNTLVDLDVDAFIPPTYIVNEVQKLDIYKRISSVENTTESEEMRGELLDRFGAVPEPVKVLTDVVRLRHEAVNLGMEHVKVKNGLLIVRFVGDNNSPFFKTDTFLNMLRRVVANPERFVVKQYNNRLSMTVRKIYSVAEAVAMLRSLAASANEEKE